MGEVPLQARTSPLRDDKAGHCSISGRCSISGTCLLEYTIGTQSDLRQMYSGVGEETCGAEGHSKPQRLSISWY